MLTVESVDAKFHNPYTVTRTVDQTRCVIGRHQAEPFELMFELDGKYICAAHAHALIDLWESNSRGPLSELEKKRIRVKEDEHLAEVRRLAEMQRLAGVQPGFVYYLRQDRHIKIGYTADVPQRMKHYPPSAELLAVHPGTPDLEKQMHRDFRPYLDRGREWFDPGPQLLAHIESVRARFGDPALFAHHYRTPKRA